MQRVGEIHAAPRRTQRDQDLIVIFDMYAGQGNKVFDAVEHLPGEIVMKATDMVDAALAGLDAGELVTIPALPDITQWQAYEVARQAMLPNLSRTQPAARYLSGKAAA